MRFTVREIEWDSLGKHLGGAILVATVFRLVAYFAAISWAAWRNVPNVDARRIGDEAFYWMGGLAVIGALLLLIVRG